MQVRVYETPSGWHGTFKPKFPPQSKDKEKKN
jgi:hypothetical protein